MEQLLQQKSILISSLNNDGCPEISYAPFVKHQDKIYLYLSRAAKHYDNLSLNQQCSVMAIEDEELAQNIFARNRVSFQCESKKIESVEQTIETLFEQRHGDKMLAMFKKMDFDWFELTIEKGRLVKGFGQAFDIMKEKSELKLIPVMSIGHK